MNSQSERFYTFGDFKIDTDERLLLKGEEPVHLTHKVFDMLVVFVQNSGKVLTKDELMEAVWQDTIVEESNLKTGVHMLRKALGETTGTSLFIQTIPKRGYKFVADVVTLPDHSDEIVIATKRRQEIIIEEEEEIDDDDFHTTPPQQRLETVELKALPAPQTIQKGKRNFYIVSGFVAGLILVSGAFLIYYYLIAGKSSPFLRMEELTLSKLSNTGNVLIAHVTPDGKSIVYVTMEDNGDRAVWMRRIGNKTSVLLMPPQSVYCWGLNVTPDGDNVYYVTAKRGEDFGTLYRVPLVGGQQPQIIYDNLWGLGGFSPDGKRVLILRAEAERNKVILSSIDSANGSNEKVLMVEESLFHFISAQWSPDEKKIFCARIGKEENKEVWSVVEIPVDGGEVRHITKPRVGKIWAISFLNGKSGFVMNATDPESNLAQLWFASYPDGEITRLTNDLSYYFNLSVSNDGKTIGTAQRYSLQDIWLLPLDQPNNPRKITAEPNVTSQISWTPDRRIVYAATDNSKPHIWITNNESNNPVQLTPDDSRDTDPAVSPDGRYIVFISRRTGDLKLWRMDIDGRNPKILVDKGGDIRRPHIAPDGKTVLVSFYKDAHWRLGQVSIEGGEITKLSEEIVELFAISPDGKFVAHTVYDKSQNKTKVVVKPFAGGDTVHLFDISPNTYLLWTADGKGLLYNDTDTKRDSQSTIWIQQISGGEPKSFLTLKPETFSYVTLSPDGKTLAASRGKLVTDAVLLQKK